MQPVEGGGRETAEVGAGLRAAPELDGAAREKDEDEESGMVNRRSPAKGPCGSRAKAAFGCREMNKQKRTQYNYCTLLIVNVGPDLV